MCALGSVIGRKIGVRLKAKDDWTEYANVWGALIGPPSTLQSPAMREAMRPFKALQVAAGAFYHEALADHEAQVEAFKLRRDGRKKAAAKGSQKAPMRSLISGATPPLSRRSSASIGHRTQPLSAWANCSQKTPTAC